MQFISHTEKLRKLPRFFLTSDFLFFFSVFKIEIENVSFKKTLKIVQASLLLFFITAYLVKIYASAKNIVFYLVRTSN